MVHWEPPAPNNLRFLFVLSIENRFGRVLLYFIESTSSQNRFKQFFPTFFSHLKLNLSLYSRNSCLEKRDKKQIGLSRSMSEF